MSDVTKIENFVKKYDTLKQEIAKVIIGQEDVVNQILISIFSGGHSGHFRWRRVWVLVMHQAS